MLGITFKENVPDIRNSKAFDLLTALRDLSPLVSVFDPIAELNGHELSFPLNPQDTVSGFDVIVLAVPHKSFVEKGWAFINQLASKSRPVFVMDIKAKLNRKKIPKKIELWRP